MDIKRLCLKEKLNKEIKDSVSNQLNKKYLSLSEDLKNKYLSEFALKDSKSLGSKRADLFLLDENNFNFYYFSEEYDYLEIGSFSLKDGISNKFEEFKEEIKKIIISKTQNKVNFEGIEESPNFKYVKEEMQELKLEPDQINIAKELKNEFVRDIINKIGNGMWLSEFKEVDKIVLETALQKLESYNLIMREYVVFCNETKAQIIRVTNYKVIEQSRQRGFKCFSCGRMLDDEKIDHFITLTDAGKLFAKKNFWMGYIISAYLYDHLKKDLKIFFKEEIEKTSLDLIINYQSKLILLQIKQDKIDLADLYYFMNKKRFYNVDFGCIFSLIEPDPVVKYFLGNKNAENIELYTQWDEFYGNIPKILDRACSRNIAELINIFADNTKIDITDYLQEYLKEAVLMPKKEITLVEEKKETIPVFEEKPAIAVTEEKESLFPAPSFPAKIENDYIKADFAIKELVDNIIKNGILNIKNDAEKTLKDVCSTGVFSCALVDEVSGYYIYNFLSDKFEKEEEIGPYFAEIFSQATSAAGKLSIPLFEKLYFEAGSETVSLYNAGDLIIVMLGRQPSRLMHEEGTESFYEDEKTKCSFIVSLSGEVTINKTEEDINLIVLKDFVFNLYDIAKPFLAKAGIEKIDKIAVENKDYEVIAVFEEDKINFILNRGQA